jgi:hypothetical protein
MVATITVRWLLIYFCAVLAAAPLIFQLPVGISHICYAIISLFLIYTAPVPKKEDKS